MPAAVTEALPLVGVAPFVNRTGNRDLDWLGDGAARLVADTLTRSRHVRVVSPLRLADLRGTAGDDASLLRAAAASGLSHVVTATSCRLAAASW